MQQWSSLNPKETQQEIQEEMECKDLLIWGIAQEEEASSTI